MNDTQYEVLKAIEQGPKTAKWIAESKGVSRANRPLLRYDQVLGRMRRLEDKGIVRRTYPATHLLRSDAVWELTQQGRQSLALHETFMGIA